jgi:hypothetical protein
MAGLVEYTRGDIGFFYIIKQNFHLKNHCSRKVQIYVKASQHYAESNLRRVGSFGPQKGIKLIFIGKTFNHGPI